MLYTVDAVGLVMLGVCVATALADGVTVALLIGLKSTLSLKCLVIPLGGDVNSGIY